MRSPPAGTEMSIDTAAASEVAAPSAAGQGDVVAVWPAARLRGDIRVPGDKSISHRALLLAALAAGESTIGGAGDGADVRSTASLVAALGVSVERLEPSGARSDASLSGTVDYRLVSPGVDSLREPADVIDCGNSGTTLRLAVGLLAGLPMTVVLTGDASLRRR